ncbi:MAG: InlB B-repeat-containing protein [Clostridia bacterium]|nr:InlB B-repeat-containing protein [Clostridia bacterium]
MKKSAVLISLCLAAGCAVFAAGCFFTPRGEDSPPENKPTTVTYHLNGGYFVDYKVDDDGTYSREVYNSSKPNFKPINARRDTWIFDGWYYDEQLTEPFVGVGLPQDSEEVHLYAKWNDKITVTAENFEDYFFVSAKWNGYNYIPAAGVQYEVSPKWNIDPVKTTVSIEFSATPKLGSWIGEEHAFTVEGDRRFKAGGMQFIDKTMIFSTGATVTYHFQPEEFDIYLLHKDPLTVTFDPCGGTVDTPTVEFEGGSEVLKSSLPQPVREGYVFEDWYLDAEYTKAFLYYLYVDRPLTLYAKWTAIDE